MKGRIPAPARLGVGQTASAPAARRLQRGRTLTAAAAAAASGSGPLLRAVDSYAPFPSTLAPPRRIDVMLPPSYVASPAAAYPVLYMHDGQNCIDPASSFSGVDWGLDEALQQLLEEQQTEQQQQQQQQTAHSHDAQGASSSKSSSIREFISVLVWNTPERLQEFMPAAALRWLMTQQEFQCWYDAVEPRYYNPTSDAYLDMLVQEVKPFIDRTYRTLQGPADTAMMGSSMGGLVSLYALQRHPEVFGAAACLSTHWTPGGGLPVAFMAAGNIPDPATHRLYFDHGSEGLDADYAPYQRQVDRLCLAAGYKQGVFQSLVFSGEGHNEAAWRKRLKIPLRFLFGTQQQQQDG